MIHKFVIPGNDGSSLTWVLDDGKDELVEQLNKPVVKVQSKIKQQSKSLESTMKMLCDIREEESSKERKRIEIEGIGNFSNIIKRT